HLRSYLHPPPPPPPLSTLSLHDALPICLHRPLPQAGRRLPRSVRLRERPAQGDVRGDRRLLGPVRNLGYARHGDELPRPQHVSRSEEHTSELQSRFDLVCRLLLEKKNMK